MNSHEIEGILESMLIGERREVEGVIVTKRQDGPNPTWFTQKDGGGTQFSRSARAAAKKVVWLRNNFDKL